ncbi:NADH dehydrogenase [ubiquinone] 1 alpha subcomplex assembly factor 2 [Aplysia californica]|uniref:NADH dehydrogenase [ubiquinone] 1 alpha subcomplex assembly factor 2 n=1 Tax=Aplysia californica TaxID=6500 RepID=A0ABM1A948_APLCA|nr:NADH dehydrogenase [ubiquinone] 1 alpha subcomplex assembly factor 2 [Aplysia californica]
MARRFGLIGKFFENFKNSLFVAKQKTKFVGTDQFGNKYFEKEGDDAHNLRASRYIEERKDLDRFDTPEVPVEWDSWLRGRREHPPSPEEIERNYKKMMQTKIRADKLDMKNTEQKESESLAETESQTGIGETVVSNTQKSEFPVYEEYEITPGSKYPNKGKR